MRACLSLFRFLTHFSLNPASPTTSPFTVADVHAKIADVCATAGRLEAALEAAKAAATIKEECFKGSDAIAAATAWERVGTILIAMVCACVGGG